MTSFPNVEEFLEHTGVKGMKWGVRKAEYQAMDSKGKSAQRTKYRLDSSGGSKGKAIAKLAGKRFLASYLTSATAVGLSHLASSTGRKSVARGVAYVNSGLQTGILVQTIIDAHKIAKS